MTRRSLFATLAAIFLPKPKALSMKDWTVAIETGPSYGDKRLAVFDQPTLVDRAWFTRYGDDKVTIIEHHFTFKGTPMVVLTLGNDVLDIQEDLNAPLVVPSRGYPW